MVKNLLSAILILLISTVSFADFLGFFPQKREAEKQYETIFLNTPSPESARKWLRWLTEEPHVAGTEADKRTAEYVRDRLKEFGLSAELVEYEVYLNYPKNVSLRMLAPQEQELSLREEGEFRDKDSFSGDVFPAFHGYGASGTATGQVVYVNYGTREDFDQLEDLGIPIAGKIALVRYGKVFRGLKVREAQERNAAGILIYSDPADDGYMKGDVYPHGPMRPDYAVQRGSVQFLSEGPGDPTTPGWASTKGARRVDPQKTRLARIPSLPLSYGEAKKILKALGGPNVPEGWQGGLPFAYHLGPGAAEVKMDVEMDYKYRTIWNVICTIEGTVEKDRLVILGNHRDAWTYGAVDPNSGTASFLEAARGLAAAMKAGWKPQRTLILASWDGEEYGLLGSTEWVEQNADEFRQKAVAYVNLDSSVPAGDISYGAIPSFRDLIMEVSALVPEPRTGKTLLDSWSKKKKSEWAASVPPDLHEPDREFYLNVNALGSGSDFTPFLQHLGIASIDMSFEGPYGVYHSQFDDLYWMEHFGDPEFLYHKAAAQVYGLLAMRLATADVVPMRYSAYARHLQEELDDIRRENIVALRKYTPESKKKEPLKPDFDPIIRAISDFASAASELDTALDHFQENSDPALVSKLNQLIVQVEREFCDQEGLTGRTWFKHFLFAPGFTTGYAPWPLPGITQALKDRDSAMFDKESKRLVDRLNAGIAKIREATALVKR